MDYDDEETDSDEDIRETYGYDMKVREAEIQDPFKSIGCFFSFFLILIPRFAGPWRGEALPVLRRGDSCQVRGSGQSHVASCDALLLRRTCLLLSLQILCAK